MVVIADAGGRTARIGRRCAACKTTVPVGAFRSMRSRKCIECLRPPVTRWCTSCQADRPADGFVRRGRVCGDCRAEPRYAHRNKPRACWRCHETKPAEQFGPPLQRRPHNGNGRPRLRSTVCKACVELEVRAKEQRAAERRATWTREDGVVVRRCSNKECGVILPLEDGFYIYRRNPRVEHCYTCKACTSRRTTALRKRRAQDPATRDAETKYRRESARKWRQENPEHNRELQKKHRERRKADPVKYAHDLEMARMRYRAKNPRQLKASTPAQNNAGPSMPAQPLMVALDAWMVRHEMSDMATAQLIGTSDRRFRDWRREGSTTRMSVADAALIAMDLLWFDIWSPEEYPEVAEIWEGE